MAEAFGLAASALSVASLAIQLGDSLRTAYEFWSSIEDGPEDIHRISNDLLFLSSIFHSISQVDLSGGQGQLVKSALATVKKDVDELAALVSELTKAIGPDQTRMRRRWGRVKIVLKGGTIAKMRGYIESSKSILILLEAGRTQSAVSQMNAKLDMLAATFSTQTDIWMTAACPPSFPPPYQRLVQPAAQVVSPKDANDLPWNAKDSHLDSFRRMVQTKTSLRTIDTGLGTMILRTTSTSIGDHCVGIEKQSIKKTFVVNFLWRFATCRRGFRLSINDTFDSWSFNTIQKRSADSRIFELCKIGNAYGVDELLRYGRASVFDADPEGATPLHYACKYGHSNLARLLVDRGADIYARTDIGNAPIEELEDYDRRQDVNNRRDVASIVDTMIHYADFDPFDWEYQDQSFDTLTLWNGLPYENLRYLSRIKDCYTTPEQRFDFILGNILQLRDSVESNQECIDLLLTEYEKLRSTTKSHDGWRYNFTLLQHLVFHWLDRNEGLGRGAGLKISRALKLTNDLWRRDREGTVLDTVARYDGKMASKWLAFLSQEGVDMSEYRQYEQAQHPEGIIDQGPDICCRIIEVKFRGTDDDLDLEVWNACDPHFQHLDSEYRCAASRRRELCISKMDDAFIGDDGKPLASIPGSWTMTLKPNSELPVALKLYEHGWQYTDLLEAPYKLWEDDWSESESESGPRESFEVDSVCGDGTDTSEDEDEDIFGEKKRPMPRCSKKDIVDNGPDQKSPRSGWEAPVNNTGYSQRNSKGTPTSKSPSSGHVTPNNCLPLPKARGPTLKTPCSGKEAPK